MFLVANRRTIALMRRGTRVSDDELGEGPMTPNEERALAWLAGRLDWEHTLANLHRDTGRHDVTRPVAQVPMAVGRVRPRARSSSQRERVTRSPIRGMLDRVRARTIPA
jgi:hypothetical protein